MGRRVKTSVIILAFLAAAGAVTAAATGCESFFNDVAGTPYRIVFASNRDTGDANYEIYVMNADGSGQTRLTDDPAVDDNIPKTSPDGSQIAYCKGGDIYVMNIDGTGRRFVITATATASPSWSPDGGRIVYAGSNELRVVNVDGTGDFQLLSRPGADINTPNWSGRTGLVAFHDNSTGSYHIYAMAPRTGAPVIQMTGDSVWETNPYWSPDGSKLIYDKLNPAIYGIFIKELATGAETLFYYSGNSDAHASFSPDGEKVSFYSQAGGVNQIFVIDADGTGLRQLTSSGANQYPTWAP